MGRGKTISVDLRERIVHAVEVEGQSYREAAARFAVGEASVSRYLGLYRHKGSVAPVIKRKRRPTVFDEVDRDMLRTAVGALPDWTLPELVEAMFDFTGKRVSTATMGREVRALGITKKKNAVRHGAGQRARRRAS